MRLRDAKECIKELYTNTEIVTALVSERGVGKTSAYKQSAKELGIDYIALYAAALEGPDFMGLPVKDIDKGITKYLAPQFLPTKQSIENGLHQEKGILVLEEINRVPSDTISVLYPLLLERKINGHVLGEGWRIGVTMNPDTLNYLVNSLDDAMIDRFVTIEVEANLEDYITYSRETGANETVLRFLEANPDMLLMHQDTKTTGMMTKAPTPRGWTKVQEVLNQCRLPKALETELVTGIVGAIAAASFEGFISGGALNVPSAKEILTDYTLHQQKIQKLLEENEIPAITGLIERVIVLLDQDEGMIRELDCFLEDLPNELGIFFYKTLSREREEMLDYLSIQSVGFEKMSDLVLEHLVM